MRQRNAAARVARKREQHEHAAQRASGEMHMEDVSSSFAASRSGEEGRGRVRIRLSDGAMIEAWFLADEQVEAISELLALLLLPDAAQPVLTSMPPVKVLAPAPYATTQQQRQQQAQAGQAGQAGEQQEGGAGGEGGSIKSLGLVPTGVINCRGLNGRLDRASIRPDVLQGPNPTVQLRPISQHR